MIVVVGVFKLNALDVTIIYCKITLICLDFIFNSNKIRGNKVLANNFTGKNYKLRATYPERKIS